MELKFYYCEDCGNLVIMIKNSGIPVVCCGQRMVELTPGAGGGSPKKHTPIRQVTDGQARISLGADEHPMEEEHFIEWVALQTRYGVQHKALRPGQPPVVTFTLDQGDEVEAVYGYCSLHGLWKG